MTLTLAKLAEIEAAAEDALKWRALTGDGRYLSNVCDPATVAALCKVTRAAYNVHVLDHNAPTDDALEEVLRDAGLLE